MEVIRFINNQPVKGDMPSLKVVNDGMLQIIREIQIKAIQEEARMKEGSSSQSTLSKS